MSASSALSRRISEFVGVLSFAAALLWLIALATYNPADPVWFFTAGVTGEATNLAGRAGAFLAYLSYQAVGYAAYLLPVLGAAVGWYRFWCTPIDAPYTKLVGATLLSAALERKEQAIALAFRVAHGMLKKIHHAAVAGNERLLIGLPVRGRA